MRRSASPPRAGSGSTAASQRARSSSETETIAGLAHCAEHPHAVRALCRGVSDADGEIIEILAAATGAHADRILAVLCPGEEPHPLLVIAVRGWADFLRTAAYEGADAPTVLPAEIREVCVNTLLGILLNLPGEARSTGLAAILE